MKKINIITAFIIGFGIAISCSVHGAVYLNGTNVGKKLPTEEIIIVPVKATVEPITIKEVSQPTAKTVVKSDIERILELEARVSALEKRIK